MKYMNRGARLAALLACCALGCQLKAQVSFVPSSTPAVGTEPFSVTTADLNGDGQRELICTDTGGNTLSILTNNGSGGYAVAASPMVANNPGSVMAADLNGDGQRELICSIAGGNALLILTNDGSGGYAVSASLTVDSNPFSVIAADVNGDGKLDLICANYDYGYGNTLSVLTNDGSGGFALASSPVVGGGPVAVVAADVNGDGKVDLICANYGVYNGSVANGNTLSVLTNDGSGGFVLASSPTVGSGPNSIVAVDVNGDGKADLVCANLSSASLSVLTNDGRGGFVLASSPMVGNNPSSVIAADVNGDGAPDLICANGQDDTLSVLTNNGSGGFALACLLNVGSGPNSVTAADLNGDGKLDLVCADNSGNTLSVLTNATPFPSRNFLTNGLVAYYPFNGNANDASGNGNNASFVGGIFNATDRFGKADMACYVATNGSIHLPSTPSFQTTNATFAFWFQTESNILSDQPNNSFCQFLSAGPDHIPLMYVNAYYSDFNADAMTLCYWWAGIGGLQNEYYTVPIGDWNQFCLVLIGSNQTVYVNSLQVYKASNYFGNFAYPATDIGNFTGDTNTHSARGSFNDFRIYNRALSEWEVQELYEYESTPPPIPPSITNQPQSILVNEHATATFSVAAAGTGPLGYQWLHNGTNLPNATASTLTIANVRPFNVGKYFVVVTNNYGSVTSSVASLTMNPNYANVIGPFLTAAFAITLTEQAGSTYKGGVTTTANPTSVHLATTNILSWLAVDEAAEGNWPSNSFPKGSALEVASGRFVVMNGTNFLVDVADVLSLTPIQPKITYGKLNNSTGMALPSVSQEQFASISFNDTSTNGGRQFFLDGILTQTRTDSTPARGKYTETQTLTLSGGVGNGCLNNGDSSFICTGSFTASESTTLAVP